MKKNLELIVFLVLFVVVQSENPTYKYKIKTFEVPVDHFSYTQNATFSIRYLVNDTFLRYEKANSPILFYTGNEGDIELFAQNTGFMWEIAPKMEAMLVFAEHRYYGQSLPFGNKSYDSPATLGYLSSEQALADYADLLQDINPHNARPVIAFGGSYGGMLAAWFRMKYPHLVQGAIASSAPILQFGDIRPCDVFNRILTTTFTTAYKPACSDNIRRSWNVLKNYTSTPEGRSYLNTKFKFCSNLTKPEDYKTLSEYLTDVYGNLAMVNYPYPSSFLAPLPAYPVREFCGRLDKQITDNKALIDGLQLALSVYSNYTGTTKCLDIASAYDSSMGDQGWNFQACTEMVMPMCSTGVTDMFLPESWDIKQYSDDCFKKFSVRPRPNTAITTYGDEKLETASNIVFSNGLLDPWSGGGVFKTRNDKIIIYIIPDGAHHLDLRASNPNDGGSVVECRKLHITNIHKWILEFHKKKNYVNPIFAF